MATVRKTIGRVPVYRGDYKSGTTYYMHNIVSYMGSSFVCVAESTTIIPCVESNGELVLNNGWNFLADASIGAKMLEAKEEDIQKEEFDAMKEAGTLDPNKRYYIYEE